ncbi:MAG TPA: polyhydroxyalkanoic acid system family protein [Pyrinomonadaceae bacterium]|nr:polyhydroxyalkanoic acid system family protein [Pyrinomonadaceae bacterium]
MPRYRTEVTHTLGQPEALARMRALAEYGRRTSGLEGEWSDNTLEFSLTIQGVSLTGTISVEPDVLKFDGRLPIVALPFKSWINRALKKGLEQAGPGGPMSATAAGIDLKPELDASIVLFLHIPKAGGSTLGEYVYNQCCAPGSSNEDPLDAGVAYLDYGFLKPPELVVPEHVVNLLGRRDLRAVIGHFWFGLHEHVARPCRYVTLLRDPVERVVSLYYYAKLEETMSLEEFARKPPFREVDNDQTRRIAGVNPPVGECTRATLDLARQNLRDHFDVVGTTERMDETLAQLKLKLGWNREVVSFPRNVNTARPSSSVLTREAVEAVRARNELDYELWRYASELLDADIRG